MLFLSIFLEKGSEAKGCARNVGLYYKNIRLMTLLIFERPPFKKSSMNIAGLKSAKISKKLLQILTCEPFLTKST